MMALLRFVTRVYDARGLIGRMAVQDLRARYAGTLAGMLWLVVHPAAMIFVYWFIFSVGFKISLSGGVPFILYFLSGIVPWLLFNEVLHCSVTAVTGKAYLVNRSVFPTEILPVVSFVSALIPHVFLIAILFGFLFAYDIPLSIWALQIVYLTVCLGILGIGLGWLVASINVFYRDVGQIVTIVLNIWFWMTPIIWRIDMLPENMHGVLRLNPLYHVTEAYRAAFLFGKPVWLDASGMANFWVFTLLVFLLGAFVFRRLKPEFADVI